VVSRPGGQNGKLCHWHQRLASTQCLHLQGSTPKNAKTGAVGPSSDREQYYHNIKINVK